MTFSNSILAGEELVRTGMRSANYVPGVAGWRLDRNGNIEANTGTFRGAVVASSFATGIPNQRRVEITSTDVGRIRFWEVNQTSSPGYVQATGGAVPGLAVGTSSALEMLITPGNGTMDLKANVDLFLTAGEITLTATQITLDAADILDAGPWQIPGLSNGWTNFGSSYQTARYRKKGRTVQIRGLVNNGTISSGSSGNIFVLPAGYRPAADVVYATIAGNALARVDVLASGDVRAVLGVAGYFSINVDVAIG